VRYKKVGHRPIRVKQFPWPICSTCGLLYLRNDVTRKSIKRGCEVDDEG